MADVFISYVRSDRQIAEAISRELSALGVSTFFDAENIVFGGALKKQIEEHIQKSSLIIVVWSEEAEKSLFVREEIRVALEAWENGRLFLVRLDNAELPIGLRDINCHDYSGTQPDKVAVSIASDVLTILSPLDLFRETGAASRQQRLESPPRPPEPPVPKPPHRRSRTWIKYSIAILLLVWLGLSNYYTYTGAPQEEPAVEDFSRPPDAILPTGTIAIIIILLTIFLSIVVGLVLFFKRRRRLLASAERRLSEDRHEHKEFGSPSEGVLFISYSRDDRPKVNVIVNKLERSGLKIWLDTRREADAQRFARSIVQAIRASKACAFMCSSTAYRSDHVVRELYLADKYSKPMIPVEIETCTPSEDFEYFFSGLEFIPYKPIDRCVQVIIHQLQSSQPPKNI